MNFFIPHRRFDPNVPEFMDRPGNEIRELADDLKNLRNLNKYFGGLAAVRKPIRRFFLKAGKKPIEILDLATGSADHPVSIVQFARQNGLAVHITAVDKNPQILEIAREQAAGYNEIRLLQEDLLNLSFPPKSFDIVLCSLALHHFARRDAISILRKMQELSRIGYVVNDLNRNWPAAFSVWLYTHVTTKNPITLNDAYISVLRGFTTNEINSMAKEAGLKNYAIKRRPMFRLVLAGEITR